MNSSILSELFQSSKAAILVESNKDLRIDEIEIPNFLVGNQVKVKLIYSSICGSQLGEIDAIKGPDKYLPHLLGHEGIAEVLDVGPEVKRINKGDKVILHWMKNSEMDTINPFYVCKSEIVNAGPIATFTEIAIILENRMTKISSNIPDEYLAFLGCGALTAFGVLTNDLVVKPVDELLVTGVGAIGLLIVQLASALGCKKIFVNDSNPKKIEFVKTIADVTPIYFEDLDGSQKFQKIAETTGNKKVIESSYVSLDLPGTLCLVGVTPKNSKIEIDPMPLHYGKKIIGSFGGSVRPSEDIKFLLDLIESGDFKPWEISGPSFKLENLNEAIKMIRSGNLVGKIPISFN